MFVGNVKSTLEIQKKQKISIRSWIVHPSSEWAEGSKRLASTGTGKIRWRLKTKVRSIPPHPSASHSISYPSNTRAKLLSIGPNKTPQHCNYFDAKSATKITFCLYSAAWIIEFNLIMMSLTTSCLIWKQHFVNLHIYYF